MRLQALQAADCNSPVHGRTHSPNSRRTAAQDVRENVNPLAPVGAGRRLGKLAFELLSPHLVTPPEKPGSPMPGRYYHVIFRDGAWHLYLGDGEFPLAVDPDKDVVLKAARARARQYGTKVIVHRAPHEEERRPGRPY